MEGVIKRYKCDSHVVIDGITDADIRLISRAFFERLWGDPNRRFVLFANWLKSRPVRSSDGVVALEKIVETLLNKPGDVCATFVPIGKNTMTGQRVSFMADHAFTLEWSWFTLAERRFFLWLASLRQYAFQRAQQQDKGIQLDGFLHSDVVWSKRSRRLLLRDLILFCRWQEPQLHALPYFLLIAVQRLQMKKDAPKDRDNWFLTQMADTLQGQRGSLHEMLIDSPRKPRAYVPSLLLPHKSKDEQNSSGVL